MKGKRKTDTNITVATTEDVKAIVSAEADRRGWTLSQTANHILRNWALGAIEASR